MTIFEKKLNGVDSYRNLRNLIYAQTNRKDVRIYPMYNEEIDINGIQVTLLTHNKYLDWVITQTLRFTKDAA